MSRHVALVIPTIAAVGGAERMTLELAAGLAGKEWRVTLIALSGGATDQQAAWLRERGIGFVTLGMRKAWIDPRGWRVFVQWQRRERPDVLHGHLAHGAWFARAARWLGARGGSGPAIVDTLHSTRVGGRWTRWLYRATSRLTDGVTAVSEAVRQAALEAGLAEDIRVVRNGIAVEAFSTETRPRGETFVWLAVGRLAAVKDYPRLLRAFALVLRDGRGGRCGSARLEIAGDGAERERLEAMARELGVSEQVRWHGFCENARALYAGADGVVLASRWEGLPVGLMEAAAAGLPVATTATAGALEVVIPETTGVVAVGEDDAALAAAMERVMRMDEHERQRMSAAARAHALEQFTRARMVAGYERVYREALRLEDEA